MAHKKGVGSTDNGRDSKSKRLGVKLFGGQTAKAGNIIVRQRGTKYHPGKNVDMGRTFSIHAAIDGTVSFTKGRKDRVYVNIIPEGGEAVGTIPAKPKKERKAAPVAAAPVVEEKVVMAAAAPKADAKPDDYKKIEGIGPKIAGLLHDAGYITFADLAKADVADLKKVLEDAGSRYRMHDPASWPLQSGMAAEGKWDELKVWQDEHDGGKL